MDSFIAHSLNDENICADFSDADIYWLKGQDIRDGA